MKNNFRQAAGIVMMVMLLQGLSRAQSLSDLQIRRNIHSSLVADTSLPFCAHVVKIKSSHGKVILSGHVHTESQKAKIEEEAEDIAGDGNVVNNIVIKTHKSTFLILKDPV